MPYQHTFYDKQACELPLGKIVCVGRNYLKHIEELKNEVPSEPILFIKPSTALISIKQPITLKYFPCHHEVELAVLIGKKLQDAVLSDVAGAIAGYGIALDLTLRDLQQQLKSKGLPWERAKAFDNACPISPFIPAKQFNADPQACKLALKINGEYRQNSNTELMITPINQLIQFISNYFTLLPGDIVLTGTPEGVGEIHSGDLLELQLATQYSFTTTVLNHP